MRRASGHERRVAEVREPPIGWAEVATKHDVAGLREVFEARLAATRHDVAGLREVFEARLAATEAGVRTEMHQGFRRMTVWVVSLQVATLGAVAALTRLG